MAYIDIDGLYYEGDLANVQDTEVPVRPTPYHTFNKKMKQWVLDDEKVLMLKKEILAKLDESLREKTLLLNLTDSEKESLKRVYDEKVSLLSKYKDPKILQEISL